MTGFSIRVAEEAICRHRRAMFFAARRNRERPRDVVDGLAAARDRTWRAARQPLEAALARCHANGIRAVIPHASEGGRILYEKLGFSPTDEMRLVLD